MKELSLPQKDVQLFQDLFRALLAAGWTTEEILVGPSFPGEPRQQPEIALCIGGYVVALLESHHAGTPVDAAIEQLDTLRIGFPHALRYLAEGARAVRVTDEGEIVDPIPWPSPEELLQRFEGDPRGLRLRGIARRPAQCMALTRILDHLADGHSRAVIRMPAGVGAGMVLRDVALRYLGSGASGHVLYVVYSRDEVAQTTRRFELETDEAVTGFVVETSARLIAEKKREIEYDAAPDLVLLHGLPPNQVDAVLEMYPRANAVQLVWATSSVEESETVFSYSVEDAIADSPVVAPPGFRAVKLKDVAESLSSTMAGDSVGQLIRGGNIQDDGRVAVSPSQQLYDQAAQLPVVHAGDILVPTVVSTARLRFGRVDAALHRRALAANSVLRIRVDPAKANPEHVWAFFQSEAAASALIRTASSVLGPSLRLTARSIEELTVFLPDVKVPPQPLTPIALVLTGLRTAAQELEQEGGTVPTEVVAKRLVQLAEILVPRSLNDRIVTDFPLPLALPWRRLLEAQGDPFQQVLRLRDAFEAAASVCFLIGVADVTKCGNTRPFSEVAACARHACASMSTSARIEFLEKMIRLLKNDPISSLHLPHLFDATLTERFRTLQNDFRNKQAHGAAGTEASASRLVRSFTPLVEDVMRALEFLTTLRLVQVSSISIQSGRPISRVVLFRGAAPQRRDEPLPILDWGALPDRDHPTIIDDEGKMLSLFPFIQIVADESTEGEPHLCMFKGRRKRELVGDSVTGQRELTLSGSDELDRLLRRLD